MRQGHHPVMDWCHVTFASASGAMAAQHALRGICPVVVMPVLRQVSAGCGIALRVEPEQVEQVRQILTEEMENAARLSVPLLAEAHIGHSWAEAH